MPTADGAPDVRVDGAQPRAAAMFGFCLCLAWFLGSCGPSRVITPEMWPEYSEQYRPRPVTVFVPPPAEDITKPYPVVRPTDIPARRDTPQGVTAAHKRFTTDLSAFPPIPNYESPEGERERAQSERSDKALNRRINSVCKTC